MRPAVVVVQVVQVRVTDRHAGIVRTVAGVAPKASRAERRSRAEGAPEMTRAEARRVNSRRRRADRLALKLCRSRHQPRSPPPLPHRLRRRDRRAEQC